MSSDLKIAIPIYKISLTSGISKHTIEVVKHFVKRGHVIHMYTSAYQYDDVVDGVTIHNIFTLANLFKNINKTRLGFLINKIVFVLEASVLLFVKKNQFDIIWNNGCGQVFYQDIITAASCHKEDVIRKLKKRQFFRVFLNPLNYLILFLEKINYSRIDQCRIIAISQVVKQQLVELYGLSKQELQVIYHGIESSQYDLAKKQFYRKQLNQLYGFDDFDTIISFTANVYDTKGLDVLFKAIFQLKNSSIRLLIIGEDHFKKAKYQKLAQNYGITNQVFFVGLVKDVSSYMIASDMFVFPTRIDAFGMVILEAMASGLPIITTSKAGASELLTHKKSALILDDPEDDSLLASYIRCLILDKEYRDTLGNNAKEISKNYEWAKIADEHLRFFDIVRNKKMDCFNS